MKVGMDQTDNEELLSIGVRFDLGTHFFEVMAWTPVSQRESFPIAGLPYSAFNTLGTIAPSNVTATATHDSVALFQPYGLKTAVLPLMMLLPFRAQLPELLQQQQQQQEEEQRRRQTQNRKVICRCSWSRPLVLLLLSLLSAVAAAVPAAWAAEPGAALPHSASATGPRRLLLQDGQQQLQLPPSQPQISVLEQQDRLQQPPAPPPPPPPPPPSFVGLAGTSQEFFRLLYSGSNVTEIRLLRDIKLLAADAVAAAAAAAAAIADADAGEKNTTAAVTAAATADTDTDDNDDAAAAAALDLGFRVVLLTRNLTIVGYGRGTHTRLDINFLPAILRLGAGVRLTFRKVELYKALNQVGQVLGYDSNSGSDDSNNDSGSGSVLELEDCVQRRAACLPFPLALAQTKLLPAPRNSELVNQSRDVYLRNTSAFCWSTSSLLPICKQPSMVVRSLAVHVPPREGVWGDTGGYDVSYSDSHIVCDFSVDASCLQTATADQCLTDELVRRFGEIALWPPVVAAAEAPPPLPPLQAGSATAAGVVADFTQQAATGGRSDGGGGGSGDDPSRGVAVGLAAGLAGGGGALALVAASLAGMYILRRRQWWWAAGAEAEAATAVTEDGKNGDGPGPAAAVSGAAAGVEGCEGAAAMATGSCAEMGVLHVREIAASVMPAAVPAVSEVAWTATASTTSEEENSGARGDRGAAVATSASGSKTPSLPVVEAVAAAPVPAGSGCISGGGAVALTAAAAAAAAAATANGREELDPPDIRSVRLSLQLAAQGHQVAPLQVQVSSLLGEGSFGKVYKGVWQGTVVALKTLVLSGNLTQSQRRRQMAVMEAAISSSMSHPNIVKTYTYSFRPLWSMTPPESTDVMGSGWSQQRAGGSPTALGASGGSTETCSDASPAVSEQSRMYGHELLLVLEYCDWGSLRQALDAGVFHRYGGGGGGDCGGTMAVAGQEEQPQEPPVAAPPPPQSPSVCQVDRGGVEEIGWLTPAAELSTLTGPPTPQILPPPPAPPYKRGPGGGVADAAIAPTTITAAAAAGGEFWSPEQSSSFVREQRTKGQLSYNYGLMLQVACEVASALLHLHSHGVVHGDVKASNVLLKAAGNDRLRWGEAQQRGGGGGGGGGLGRESGTPGCIFWQQQQQQQQQQQRNMPPPSLVPAAPSARSASTGGSGGPVAAAAAAAAAPLPSPRVARSLSSSGMAFLPQPVGLVAKVADFGLSTFLGFDGDEERTHITEQTTQGALTHMAPELMLHGHISKRVDVYAFGIMMYELFTGQRAHRGAPRALLPHQVVMCGLRPALPAHTPLDLRRLIESCWAQEPNRRPDFNVILAELERMRAVGAAQVVQTAAAVAPRIAAAEAANRGTSVATTSSRCLPTVFSYNALRPDGWVLVPPLDSSTCSSTLFEELVGTREERRGTLALAQGVQL